MPMKWFTRLAILVVVPAVLAGADAMMRPLPPGLFDEEEEQRGAQEGPASWEEEVAWLLGAFDKGAIFIDARSRREYVAGHVAGSVHLPFEAFQAAAPPAVLDFLPQDHFLVIYCDGGDCDASRNVRRMLRTHGYTEMRIFEPGWAAIADSGLPIVEGEGDW